MTEVDLARRIGDLLVAGKKIEAIKALREAMGLGLAEARDVVDALEQGRPLPADLQQKLARTVAMQGDDATGERVGEGIPDDVRALAVGGNRIAAIKRLREHTGHGLKDAKDLLDRAVPVPGGGGKRGCLLPLLFGCALGAVACGVFA